MKCPKCGFEDPESKKFCGECGSKIELFCPKCQSPNPPQFKFCGDCGHSLAVPYANSRELSFDEKLQKVQKYLPAGITEKILSQRDKIEGERKQVTVMFCDMKGFTPLSEKLGPENMYSIMDRVYEIMIQKVLDYDGTVNEMTGDGIMALFGAPIALEDAPQRAIRSAIAIHREMILFNDKIRKEFGDIPPLRIRAGIHSGPVIVGTLGNDLRVEFKAVGNTVNFASRMESLAEPGTTYVSDDTFRLTEGYFRFESLGEREIKGKEKPLKVYQVIAPSTRRTRFDVSAERGLTPFIGRERELDVLLDAFERSKEGRGQAISIISDAGIGKSRLLYEFRKAVTNENVTFLEGRCLSYSRNVAYHPVADVLRGNFEINDNDSDQAIRDKVTAGLQFMNVDQSSTLPYLLELLAVKQSGIDKINISPEERKYRTIEALKRIVLKGSELRPLIMAIEDLHWMDRSSEDAFKEFLAGMSAARILLILTYRPEFVHTWGSRSYHSQITLNRLSNREALAMATYMLGSSNIERNLEDLILQKTDGIPFFLEEFIKSLKDIKAIEKKDNTYHLSKDIDNLAIPSTIQDVIMARVDNLPEGAKEVLRTGSAIEREFSYDLIQRVTNLPEKELLSNLSTLKDSELLFERGIYPDCAYIFKHALTREVVYDSILTKNKKQIHEKIADTMEDIYKDDICYHYGVLASHCIASENYEKGSEYARLEARRYQKAALFKDAIEYAKKTVACSEHLPQTEANQKRLIDARITLANYILSLSHYSEAKDAVEPVIHLAQQVNYRKRLPEIYNILGLNSFFIDEDISKGLSYLNEAKSLSEELGDMISLWFTSYNLSFCLLWNCEFEKSLAHIKRCLEMSCLVKNPRGIAFSKYLITANYQFRGRIKEAYEVSKDLLMAYETGDNFTKGPIYVMHGSALYYRGLLSDLSDAEKYLLEGLHQCENNSQIVYAIWPCFHLGFLYFDMGEYKKSQYYFDKCISLFEENKQVPSWITAYKTYSVRAKLHYYKGDVSIANLIDTFEGIKLKYVEGWVVRCLGDILIYMDGDHLTDAEVWIKNAIEMDSKHNMTWYLATDHARYAEWFKNNGDIVGAREQFTKAIDLFKECGADGWVTRTEKTLAELH